MVTRGIALLLLCGVVAGCVSPEEQRRVDLQRCDGFGFEPGTDAYANCMMNIGLERDAERAATNRATLDRIAADNRARAAREVAAKQVAEREDRLRRAAPVSNPATVPATVPATYPATYPATTPAF